MCTCENFEFCGGCALPGRPCQVIPPNFRRISMYFFASHDAFNRYVLFLACLCLCCSVGGQSNAQFTVDSAFNSSAEVAAAGNFPTIRVFTVGQGTKSSTPLPNLVTIEQAWAVASPASVGVGNWSAISAIGWFFARDLTVALDASVPIGIL